jgi:hypothetical protein
MLRRCPGSGIGAIPDQKRDRQNLSDTARAEGALVLMFMTMSLIF